MSASRRLCRTCSKLLIFIITSPSVSVRQSRCARCIMSINTQWPLDDGYKQAMSVSKRTGKYVKAALVGRRLVLYNMPPLPGFCKCPYSATTSTSLEMSILATPATVSPVVPVLAPSCTAQNNASRVATGGLFVGRPERGNTFRQQFPARNSSCSGCAGTRHLVCLITLAVKQQSDIHPGGVVPVVTGSPHRFMQDSPLLTDSPPKWM